MKKRRWICLALTAALTIGMLAGCGQKKDLSDGGEKKKLQKVTLNEVAHSIFYAPMYVAIEEGYFKEEGIDLTLVTGFGADKTVTAVLAGEADIGFMGSESTIYTKNGGAEDYLINFAQLTQRAGNFLVAREPIENFEWDMLKGKKVLGGRAGGMPEMVFEYILKQHNIDPTEDLSIDQSIDFGSTAAAFSGGQGEFTVEFEPHATALEQKGDGYVVASLGEESGYVPYTAFSAKKKLSGSASGYRAGLCKCTAARYGKGVTEHAGGNRKDDCAAVPGNGRSGADGDCETLCRAGYVENRPDFLGGCIYSAAGYSGRGRRADKPRCI